jgi:hypothetical protein
MGSEARAGIVNVQSILATEAEKGLSGAVSGSIDWRTGNHTRLLLSIAPVARYRTGPHLVIALLSGEYYRDTDDLRFFEHVRYRYRLSARILGEVFAQHERNDKRLLVLRAVVGAGPKLELVDRDKLHVGVGVAYMLEVECLKYAECLQDGAPDPYLTLLAPEESPSLNHRASSYLTVGYEIDERLQLVQTLYAQPRLTDLGDIRLLSESALVVKLSKHLSFKTSFTLAYDSMPPEYEYNDPNNPDNPGLPDVKATDTALNSTITYDF